MANPINEMMKQFGSFANFDFTKSFEIMQAFDPAKISQQMFDFQKSTFDSTFENMMSLLKQSDQLTASFMCDNKLFPEAGVKMLEDWRLSCRKSQLEFKKNIDESYKEFISSLTPEPKAEPTPEAAAAPETKTAAAPETKTAAAPETKTAAAPETKTAAAPEPKTAAAPKTKTAAAPEAKAASTPKSKEAKSKEK